MWKSNKIYQNISNNFFLTCTYLKCLSQHPVLECCLPNLILNPLFVHHQMEKEERELNGGGKMKEGVEVIITWTLMTVPQFLTHTHSQHLTMSKCCAELDSTLTDTQSWWLKYCERDGLFSQICLFNLFKCFCFIFSMSCSVNLNV